jgi:hypothetical protein
MWPRVEVVLTDVSEESIASILKVENKKKSASEPAWAGAPAEASSSSYIYIYKFSNITTYLVIHPNAACNLRQEYNFIEDFI